MKCGDLEGRATSPVRPVRRQSFTNGLNSCRLLDCGVVCQFFITTPLRRSFFVSRPTASDLKPSTPIQLLIGSRKRPLPSLRWERPRTTCDLQGTERVVFGSTRVKGYRSIRP
ncbi:hypothetical protein EVAR_65339_1 [Eumeta japonica]|uniref:Uncharacterized protein n=1 Tax=Eumeta variegata TaxID=151549 RepID=A0A4C1YW03_EUMVA|nr:hypothetical protein EVAR_65339_1 [Eumeta japonica]